jgi:hypothetical protein
VVSRNKPQEQQADRVAGRGRRELLAGTAGALGVITVGTIAGADPAQAANGNAVLQGSDNGPATSRTMVFTANDSEFASLADPNTSGQGSLGVYGHGQDTGVLGEAAKVFAPGVVGNGGGNGDGVHGNGNGIGSGVVGKGGSTSGTGVTGLGGPDKGVGVQGEGTGTGTGVVGKGGMGGGLGGEFFGTVNATGLVGSGGSNGGNGVEGDGTGTGTGVVGWGGSTSGTGVVGHGGPQDGAGMQGNGQGTGDGVIGVTSGGSGVHGKATTAGSVGILAENSAGGTALQANGRAIFSRSGILTMNSGQSTATQTGIALTAASLVLAVLQQNRTGVYVQAAAPDVSASSFTVHLNKAVSSSTKVAWFIVN